MVLLPYSEAHVVSYNEKEMHEYSATQETVLRVVYSLNALLFFVTGSIAIFIAVKYLREPVFRSPLINSFYFFAIMSSLTHMALMISEDIDPLICCVSTKRCVATALHHLLVVSICM